MGDVYRHLGTEPGVRTMMSALELCCTPDDEIVIASEIAKYPSKAVVLAMNYPSCTILKCLLSSRSSQECQEILATCLRPACLELHRSKYGRPVSRLIRGFWENRTVPEEKTASSASA